MSDQKLKLDNAIGVYALSMGKIFRVACIAKNDHEANEFCRKNPDYGVISQTTDGLVLCARIYGSIAPSALLEDYRSTEKI